MGKYFGTDGFRGEAGITLTADHAYKVGRFLGWYYNVLRERKPRQPVNYAGRVAERTADNVRKPSVLAQLHAKQAERSAEPQKSQKRKSHDMEL